MVPVQGASSVDARGQSETTTSVIENAIITQNRDPDKLFHVVYDCMLQSSSSGAYPGFFDVEHLDSPLYQVIDRISEPQVITIIGEIYHRREALALDPERSISCVVQNCVKNEKLRHVVTKSFLQESLRLMNVKDKMACLKDCLPYERLMDRFPFEPVWLETSSDFLEEVVSVLPFKSISPCLIACVDSNPSLISQTCLSKVFNRVPSCFFRPLLQKCLENEIVRAQVTTELLERMFSFKPFEAISNCLNACIRYVPALISDKCLIDAFYCMPSDAFAPCFQEWLRPHVTVKLVERMFSFLPFEAIPACLTVCINREPSLISKTCLKTAFQKMLLDSRVNCLKSLFANETVRARLTPDFLESVFEASLLEEIPAYLTAFIRCVPSLISQKYLIDSFVRMPVASFELCLQACLANEIVRTRLTPDFLESVFKAQSPEAILVYLTVFIRHVPFLISQKCLIRAFCKMPTASVLPAVQECLGNQSLSEKNHFSRDFFFLGIHRGLNRYGMIPPPKFPLNTEDDLSYLDHLLVLLEGKSFERDEFDATQRRELLHCEAIDLSEKTPQFLKDQVREPLLLMIHNIKENVHIEATPENDDKRRVFYRENVRRNIYPVVEKFLAGDHSDLVKPVLIELAEAARYCGERYKKASMQVYQQIFTNREDPKFSPFENEIFNMLKDYREENFQRIFSEPVLQNLLSRNYRGEPMVFYEGWLDNVHADGVLDDLKSLFGIIPFARSSDDAFAPRIDQTELARLIEKFYQEYNWSGFFQKFLEKLGSDGFRDKFFAYLYTMPFPENFDPSSPDVPEDWRCQRQDKNVRFAYRAMFQNPDDGEWNFKRLFELFETIGFLQRPTHF